MFVYGVKLKSLSSLFLGVRNGASFNAKGMGMYHIMFAVLMVQTMAINT